jgi:hypothetical protein
MHAAADPRRCVAAISAAGCIAIAAQAWRLDYGNMPEGRKCGPEVRVEACLPCTLDFLLPGLAERETVRIAIGSAARVALHLR